MRSLDNRSTANFDECRSGTVWTALFAVATDWCRIQRLLKKVNLFAVNLDSGFHRDVAQPGSALAWGARGREFKSRRPDH
jgi:hypothetical protein